MRNFILVAMITGLATLISGCGTHTYQKTGSPALSLLLYAIPDSQYQIDKRKAEAEAEAKRKEEREAEQAAYEKEQAEKAAQQEENKKLEQIYQSTIFYIMGEHGDNPLSCQNKMVALIDMINGNLALQQPNYVGLYQFWESTAGKEYTREDIANCKYVQVASKEYRNSIHWNVCYSN